MKISDNTLQTLQSINQLIAFINPLLAGGIALAEQIVADVRSQGADVGPFADEIAKFDDLVGQGITADDAWRERHGLPPWTGGQVQPPSPTPEQPSQPAAPGDNSPPFPTDTGQG